MRKMKLAGCLMFMSGILMFSCTPSGEKARSVHVDSSNIDGDAPVRYEGDNPKDTVSRFPVGDDTGKRENTKADEEK